MVKRLCNKCEAVATIVTWCNKSKSVGVYHCEAHHDPTFRGWTRAGKQVDPAEMVVDVRPKGFRWRGE